MKNYILFIACIVSAGAGCKQVDKLTQFYMPYAETITIPATVGINLPINLITPEIETNSESTFALNDTEKDLVEEIKLISLTLNHTTPTGEDFSFLKTVRIYISADGLSEEQIAWKENIPDTAGTVLQLEISNADLKEFIKKDKFTLRVNTITDELLTSDQQVELLSVFFVDAKILGQ
jgi:hypothetical protein